MKKITSLLAVLALCLSLWGCGEAPPQRWSLTVFDYFDTVSVLTGYAPSRESFQEDCELALGVLAHYHRLADPYHDYPGVNNLKTLNEKAGEAPVPVSEAFLELLLYGVEAYTATGGRVNIAMGAVLELWHEARETGALPDPEALRRAGEHCGIRDLVLDPAAKTVYFKDPELRLDLGAVAKGYATEMAARALEEAGGRSFVLDIGGNVRTLSPKPDGSPWRVGIQDPRNAEKTQLVLALTDLSLVTSGNYQRYLELDGVRYHHIIDPETLYPENRMLSVSVLTADAGWGDVLSTALFNMDPAEGLSLVEGLPEVEACWILTDGSVKQSSGFAAYVTP